MGQPPGTGRVSPTPGGPPSGGYSSSLSELDSSDSSSELSRPPVLDSCAVRHSGTDVLVLAGDGLRADAAVGFSDPGAAGPTTGAGTITGAGTSTGRTTAPGAGTTDSKAGVQGLSAGVVATPGPPPQRLTSPTGPQRSASGPRHIATTPTSSPRATTTSRATRLRGSCEGNGRRGCWGWSRAATAPAPPADRRSPRSHGMRCSLMGVTAFSGGLRGLKVRDRP